MNEEAGFYDISLCYKESTKFHNEAMNTREKKVNVRQISSFGYSVCEMLQCLTKEMQLT